MEGTLRCRVGRQVRTLNLGDSIDIPPGTVHAISNDQPVGSELIVELSPPRRGEEGLRLLFGIHRDGLMRTGRLLPPQPILQAAVLFEEYLDEVCVPHVPLRMQRFLFRWLGFLGRRRGYRSVFVEYTNADHRVIHSTQ